MGVLDCETLDSAIETTAALLGMTAGKFVNRLREFEYDATSRADRSLYPYEELLARYALGLRRSELPLPDIVYWFHATRVPPDTTFQEGILPLSRVLENVWRLLGELALEWTPPDVWQVFRQNMSGREAWRYRLKVSSQANDGPFGFLVREAIFHARSIGNHDYLAIPEIVEDICHAYWVRFRQPLRELYVLRTSPCIVKFRSSALLEGTIEPVLMYIHTKVRGERLSMYCNTCYSGNGEAVRPEDVVAIEWL